MRNVTIQPNASNFLIGDQLMCSAEGNPEPAYTWTHLNTSRIQTGSALTLNDSSLSIGSMHVFVCTAENTVAGERKNISEAISILITGTTKGRLESIKLHFVKCVSECAGEMIIVILKD